MTKQRSDIADVLRWLTLEGLEGYDDDIEAGLVRTDVAALLAPVDAMAEDLPRRMEAESGEAGPFLLRPIHGTVPVVQFSWRWAEPRPELRVRLAVFYPGATGEPHLLGVGYRWETPEANSDHGMYHVQPIASLHRPSGNRLPGAWSNWPEKAPTFPVLARDPLELLACLVASIYGADSVRGRVMSAVGGCIDDFLSGLVG